MDIPDDLCTSCLPGLGHSVTPKTIRTVARFTGVDRHMFWGTLSSYHNIVFWAHVYRSSPASVLYRFGWPTFIVQEFKNMRFCCIGAVSHKNRSRLVKYTAQGCRSYFHPESLAISCAGEPGTKGCRVEDIRGPRRSAAGPAPGRRCASSWLVFSESHGMDGILVWEPCPACMLDLSL